MKKKSKIKFEFIPSDEIKLKVRYRKKTKNTIIFLHGLSGNLFSFDGISDFLNKKRI